MEKVSIESLPNDSMFHFTINDNLPSINERGIIPLIGENASGVEATEKIFFSKGELGIIKINEVWLRWLMNRIFGQNDRLNLYSDEAPVDKKKRLSAWGEEFLTKKYFEDEDKKKVLYDYFYNYAKERTYLVLDIHDGEEYFKEDLDENKVHIEKTKNITAKKYAEEMYGSFSDFNNLQMDDWNMHTKTGIEISPDKIKQVCTPEGKISMLDMLIYIHENNKDIPHSRFLLDDFVDYAVKRQTLENMVSEGEVTNDKNNNSRKY